MRQQLKRSVDAGLHGWSRPAAPVQAKAQKAASLEGQGFRPAVARHSLGKIAVDHSASGLESPVRRPNRTGLPDRIKHGVEALSGISLDDVTVHYNSPKPTRVQALAYAQGTEIHLRPGQEGHLPHEAWHVVQQKQGRVQPTLHSGAVNVNDDPALEKEADVLPRRAVTVSMTSSPNGSAQNQHSVAPGNTNVIQRVILNTAKITEEWKRLDQPYRKPDYPNLKIAGMDSTLHHVIPLNQLLAFVKVAYHSDGEVLERILRMAVTTMMGNSPIATRGEVEGQQAQGSQTLSSLLAELEKTGSDEANSEAVEEIIRAFSWMPGNVFLGPVEKLRTDDPRERFEGYAQNAVGEEKFERLKQADELIREYVKQPADHLAKQIEQLLVPVAEQTDHFPYKEEVWEQSPMDPKKKRLIGALENPKQGQPENVKKGKKGKGAANKN